MDRGQTTQDFAVGVGVFLLTVAFVLAYVPTALPQPASDPTASREAQADRVADEIVDNLSVAGTGTRLDATRTERFFEYNDDAATIRENFSLPATTRTNVTLEHLNGTNVSTGEDVYAGAEHRNQTAASASRLVVYNGTQYRLLVRVW